jgi:zinc transport system substrate-binding protein
MLATALFWAALCLVAGRPAAGRPLELVAGTDPAASWIAAIGGERVQVQVVLPANTPPSRYALSPERVSELANGQAFFVAGLPEENLWLAQLRRNNPGLEAVNLRTGAPLIQPPRDRRLEVLSRRAETAPTRFAPYVWTAPTLAAALLRNIRAALAGLDPDGAPVYAANYRKLAGRLDRVAERLRRAVSRAAPRREFLASRPGLGWLAADLGLRMMLVHPGDASRLEGRKLRLIIEYAAERRFPILFIRPGFREADAAAVAQAVGARLVAADPLAPDWLDELERLARILPAALR